MYTWENLLFYNKTFKKDHTLGLTFLQSIQQETYEKSEIKVKDLPYENQTWNNVGSAQTIESVSSDYQRWNLVFCAPIITTKTAICCTRCCRYDGSVWCWGINWLLSPPALAWQLLNIRYFVSNWC